MNTVKNFAKSEPVISAASISALVAALLSLLVEFGVPVTDGQQTAIQGLVAVLAPVAVILVRKYVTANANVVERAQDGHVLAGEANELPTNTHVREVGELDESV